MKFKIKEKELRNSSREYLKFICRISGYIYLTPEEQEPFDLMVRFGKKYKKIQIKTSHCKVDSDNYIFKLTRQRNNATSSRCVGYIANDVDFYFLMDIDRNCWLIPFKELSNRKYVTPAGCLDKYKVDLSR